ncbi:SAM-dependent methyltransferase [Azohydromonas aeria]|uniref:SAM-dependent methyltransferase n=1 Tax=Azohydromonas aeria TaxID=2590212 RepID=UPI0018E04A63|nr:methyltransferase domain-containing protein [Azohydromonas aeria]
MTAPAPDRAAFVLTRRRAAALALLLPCGLARAQNSADDQQPAKPLDVPYVPTPMAVVNKMLDLGRVRGGDLLYDLGCGDGRIVVTAAKERGARGVGIDIDPRRIAEAQVRARDAGVEDRVDFRVGDLFETDFSQATVVTLYLLPRINQQLRPQLWRQLRLGTRVVSHAFDMGDDWPPEQVENLRGSTVYAWTIRQAQKNAARS